MRKRIYYVLICMLLVLCLAGCSKDTKNDAEPTEGPQPSSTQDISDSTEKETSDSQSEPTPTLTAAEAIGDLSLKDFFAERNMKVGTCLTEQMINDKDLNSLILSQFSSVTMENSLKPDYIFDKAASIAAGNTELVVKFPDDAIKMLDWAKANGIGVRGHTIVWYSQTPDWIFREDYDQSKDFVSRDVMLARLESATKNVFATIEELGYSDVFYAYDIVNEYWLDNGVMRYNNWTSTIGEDYVWYALYYARQYAPENIDLYINDFNEQFKFSTAVNFFKTLVDEDGNYLMDGIGLQAHLYTEDNLPLYFRMIDTYAALGLKLQITELDVCLGAYQKVELAVDDNLKKQGKFYYTLFKGLFDRIDKGTLKMDSVTFWGVNDKLSWRASQNPLLFNKKSYPKYAFFGALQIKDKAGYDE